MSESESETLGHELTEELYQDGKTRNPQRIVERLVAAFPGNMGYSVSANFSPYLKDEIITKSQAEAYDEIMLYLDSFKIKVPLLLSVLDWYLSSLSPKENKMKSRENLTTEWLLNASDEQLELYKKALLKRAKAQQGNRGRRNPIERANVELKNRMEAAGYYSQMLPLLKQLSPTYADHMRRLEELNDKICSELKLRYDDDGYLIVGALESGDTP
ncbi:MAG: hypothetical protein FWE19_02455 [Oscillospiraceae bacterium]|nr:hypothetical protein [Oscillospiraceae bacterium]